MSDELQNRITQYNAELDGLKQSAEEYQDTMNNVHHTITEQDYKSLINNGHDQIENING